MTTTSTAATSTTTASTAATSTTTTSTTSTGRISTTTTATSSSKSSPFPLFYFKDRKGTRQKKEPSSKLSGNLDVGALHLLA